MCLVDEFANTSNFVTDSQEEWPPKHCQCLPDVVNLDIEAFSHLVQCLETFL